MSEEDVLAERLAAADRAQALAQAELWDQKAKEAAATRDRFLRAAGELAPEEPEEAP